MRSRLARAAVVLCIAIVATACSKTLDTKGLEPTLGQKIDALLSTTGVTVSCPDGIKAKAGGTFNCTATLPNGDTITVRVTQTDGNGQVAFSLVDASTPTPSP